MYLVLAFIVFTVACFFGYLGVEARIDRFNPTWIYLTCLTFSIIQMGLTGWFIHQELLVICAVLTK